MLLSLAEPAEKDEIDLWPEFRDRRILSTLHALRAEVFNNLHLYLLIIFMFSIASSFSVMLECLYRASMQFLSGNHDIFWIPACFDRFSNLRDWAWEKALKAFISRRARRARRERWDRLVARILRQTNSVHTSCPSGIHAVSIGEPLHLLDSRLLRQVQQLAGITVLLSLLSSVS